MSDARLASRAGPSARVIDSNEDIAVADMASLTCTEMFERWRSRRVVLQGPPSFLIKWLRALDGVADAVLLAPRDACTAACQRLVEAGTADVVLVAARDPVGCWPQLPVEIVVDASLPGEFPTPASPLSANVKARAKTRAERQETQWVLSTSGTTSTPKLVAHSLASLARSIQRDSRFTEYRWGLLYDPSRMAGIQVLLQALIGDATLLVPDPAIGFATQIQWLAAQRVSALSATPTLWRRILMTSSSRRLPLRQVTLGGEIADGGILNALHMSYPKARLTHVYASTEAGVGFAVHDGRAGFPADWLEAERAGVRMTIGSNGCLQLATGRMEQRYLGRDAGNIVADGWIDTGDLVERVDDRVLFCGRLNGSINVGGNKVIPEEVEGVIRELDEVAAVIVRGRGSSVMGTLVEAFVQPLPGARLVGRDIKAHCRARLAAFKVPAFVNIVEELEVSTAGKIVRAAS